MSALSLRTLNIITRRRYILLYARVMPTLSSICCSSAEPTYKTYPFLDNLETIAAERGYGRIVQMLVRYAADPGLQKYSGDNGDIHYERTDEQIAFQKAVNKVETR